MLGDLGPAPGMWLGEKATCPWGRTESCSRLLPGWSCSSPSLSLSGASAQGPRCHLQTVLMPAHSPHSLTARSPQGVEGGGSPVCKPPCLFLQGFWRPQGHTAPVETIPQGSSPWLFCPLNHAFFCPYLVLIWLPGSRPGRVCWGSRAKCSQEHTLLPAS